MKKLTTILLAVMLVAALFISCENNVSSNIEETVSVDFEGSRTRNLTAALEKFDKDKLYWKYTAVKNSSDTSGLDTGTQETPVAVKKDDSQGLGSVAGFSQGIWDFVLYAYKDSSFKQLEYEGKATASLKKDSDNKVIVTVSPVKTAEVKGTLVIDADSINITKDGETITGASVSKVYKVVKVGDSDSDAYGTETSYDLAPGAYKVTVAFVDDTTSKTYTYASGSVVATVYSNLTTTVTGSLEELLTKAEFDSAINPDIMNTVATSSTMEYSNLSSGTVELSTATETGSETAKVTATVKASDAQKIISDVVGSGNTDDTSVSLALSVDTTAATSTSLELEIGMSATVTNSKGEATTTEVKSLNSYSVVKVNLQSNLESVVVKHSGNEMTALTTANDTPTSDYGGYHYAKDTGVLTIKTKTFSPFAVTYAAPVYVAKIGSKNYTSLQDALDSVGEGGTITLYGNVTSDKGFIFSKAVNATLDLNSYTLKVTNGTTANKNRALYITNGTLTVTNGTIDARNVDTDGNPKAINQKKDYEYGIYGTVRVEGNDKAKAVLDGLTLYNNHCYGMSVKACTGNTIEIKDCDFYSTVGGCVEGAGGTITISGSTFEQNETSLSSAWASTGIAVSYGGTVTVNNTDFTVNGSTALYVYSSGGEIIINGGTYTSKDDCAAVVVNFDKEMYGIDGSSGDYKVTQEFLNAHNGKAAVVTINNGTINGKFEKAGSGVDLTDIVTTFDPTDYIDSTEYVAVQDSANKWHVVTPEAEVGETLYAYFEDALKAAESGQTVKLLKNSTLDEGVVLVESITVDLNSKTLTLGDDDGLMVGDYGYPNTNVVIKNGNLVHDRVEDSIFYHYGIFIYSGTLTLEDVTMSGGEGAKYGIFVNDENGATLAVNDSKLELSSESGIEFGGGTPSGTVTGTVTIKDSTVEGSKYGLNLQRGTSATLNNSTIKHSSGSGSAIASFGGTSIIIENSSRVEGVDKALNIQNDDDDGTVSKTIVTVNDSTLWGTNYGVIAINGNTEISGTNYTLKGDLVVYVSDGTCTINGAAIETTDWSEASDYKNVVLYVSNMKKDNGATLTLLNVKSNNGTYVNWGLYCYTENHVYIKGSRGQEIHSDYAFGNLNLESFSN